MPAESFLSRWSKRKLESRAGVADSTPESAQAELSETRSTLVPPPVLPEAAGQSVPATAETAGTPAAVAESAELPAVESLTPDSDFRPFMKGDVEPAVRNQALKSLFKDPHFNVMDMLDVYVDDYSKPDPIPESMLRQMNQSRMLKLFDDLPDEDGEQTRPAETTPAGASEPPIPVQTADPADELSQKTPDKTICPASGELDASNTQQEKI